MCSGGDQLGILVVAAWRQGSVISGTRWWQCQRLQRQLASSVAVTAAAWQQWRRRDNGGGSAVVVGSVVVGVGKSAAAA